MAVKPKASLPRRLLKWFAIAFGLCVVIGIIASLSGGNKRTTTPAATTAAVVEAATSVSPSPTVAPQPTAEPEPTSPPAPTSAMRFSASESDYSVAILGIIGNLKNAMSIISEQSSAAGADLTIMLDDDWKLKTAIGLASLQASSKQIQDLTAPSRFKAVHAELLVAADHFIQMTSLYAKGVDEISADKMGLALDHLNLGNAAIERATTEMEELVGE